MTVRILAGDCRDILRTLPDESAHCCVTSPPYYGLRDYGVDGQIGLEQSPEAFVAELVAVFREVRRVLRSDGTLWVVIGDSYAGSWGAEGRTTTHGNSAYNASQMQAKSITNHPKRSRRTPSAATGIKPKDLYGIPWMLAFALRADGWYLRQDIVWAKPNPMPESVGDRCTKQHEYVFLLSKSSRYHFDADAIAEPAFGGAPGNVAEQRLPGERLGDNANLRNGLHEYAARQRSKRYSFARETKLSAGQHGQKPQHRADRDDVDYVGTRNKRSVWTVPTVPFTGAHFATFPPDLIVPAILAGCPEGGIVLDPFAGAGTTGLVADRLQRDALLIELNPAYAAMAHDRILGDAPMFTTVERAVPPLPELAP